MVTSLPLLGSKPCSDLKPNEVKMSFTAACVLIATPQKIIFLEFKKSTLPDSTQPFPGNGAFPNVHRWGLVYSVLVFRRGGLRKRLTNLLLGVGYIQTSLRSTFDVCGAFHLDWG